MPRIRRSPGFTSTCGRVKYMSMFVLLVSTVLTLRMSTVLLKNELIPSSNSADELEVFPDISVSKPRIIKQSQTLSNDEHPKIIQTSTTKVQLDSGIISHKSRKILSWSKFVVDKENHPNHSAADSSMTVALITQCSMERLPTLYRQLLMWNGKASVAIYVKKEKSPEEAAKEIQADLEETRKKAIEKHGDDTEWDVSITLVFEEEKGEHPLNYLRNVALLDAKSLQQQMGGVKGASILHADVDFVPSPLLRKALQCKSAANAIIEKREVIVIPSFEGLIDDDVRVPESTSELKKMLDAGEASSFASRTYPPGHRATDFDKYWTKTSKFEDADSANVNSDDLVNEFWKEKYSIEYEESKFEPYIVMASDDIPLYDERFTGYYKDKISHIYTVDNSVVKRTDHGGGWNVLPGVFLFHVKHEFSEDKKMSIKQQDLLRDKFIMNKYRKMRGEIVQEEEEDLQKNKLYDDFKRDLLEHNTIMASEATFERLSSVL